jgi:hypothetical protein
VRCWLRLVVRFGGSLLPLPPPAHPIAQHAAGYVDNQHHAGDAGQEYAEPEKPSHRCFPPIFVSLRLAKARLSAAMRLTSNAGSAFIFRMRSAAFAAIAAFDSRSSMSTADWIGVTFRALDGGATGITKSTSTILIIAAPD